MNFANANGYFSNATLSYLIMMIIFIQTAFNSKPNIEAYPNNLH